MDRRMIPEKLKIGQELTKNHYFSPIFGTFLVILDINQV